jgi:hypothetical protein
MSSPLEVFMMEGRGCEEGEVISGEERVKEGAGARSQSNVAPGGEIDLK